MTCSASVVIGIGLGFAVVPVYPNMLTEAKYISCVLLRGNCVYFYFRRQLKIESDDDTTLTAAVSGIVSSTIYLGYLT